MTGDNTMRTLAIALAALCIAVPASAESPVAAGSDAQSANKSRDPNEVVCEKIEITGSRLIARRACATRAQWAERRLHERLDIDKAQKTGMKGE